MNNKYLLGTLASALVLTLSAGSTSAKVSPEEAEKLGNELTCLGGEASGNAQGTIPPFTGEYMNELPGNLDYTPHVGQHPVDPFADESPRLMITGANWRDYADKLSEGQQALFERYPNKYEIPVYEGKRIFRYPEKVCEVVKRNALEAELSDNRLGYTGYRGGPAFPIPSGPNKGLQALFNHTFPFLAATEEVTADIVSVNASGEASWGRVQKVNYSMTTVPEELGKPMDSAKGVMAYSDALTLLPTRDKGSRTFSVEPANFSEDRLAWNYNPGTRRVRQLPEYGFDGPYAGTGGKLTIDQDRLMNGSPIRYEWTLKGKREMFVPANAYRMHTKDVSYAELLQPEELIPNPDLMRYELRRVWVLEGKLKDGYRHKYGKRVMYIDEDSWMGVMSDYYDTRGQLVQHAIVNYYYSPDINAFYAGTSFYYDLNSGGYLAFNLFQENDKGPVLNAGGFTPEMFSPAALRAKGH